VSWPKGRKRPEFSGSNHPMYGKPNPMLGRKRPEISGENSPNKLPEVRAKRSKTLKEWYKTPAGIEKRNKTIKILSQPNVREKARKALIGKPRPDMVENNISKRPEVKEKKRNSIVKHHIYLKENSNEVILLKSSKHAQLHSRAYEYLFFIKGKEGINEYLKWFKEKYGLEE
jgi:hypothetical protein